MSEVKDSFQAGQILAEARRTDSSIPYLVIPDESKVYSLEHLMPRPFCHVGNPQFAQVASFIEYVNRHKNDESTLLFAQKSLCGAIMVCVFDHHSKEEPGWSRHRAGFTTEATPEWNTWRNGNGKLMGQADFATFIENNIRDIVTPTGGEMLDLVSRLEGTIEVDFTAGVRLDNGNNELRYVERTNVSAGSKGAVTVPATFDIGIQLFAGGSAYGLTARLRYRIKEKHLVFWYDLIKPHLVVDDAIGFLLSDVQKDTGLKPLMGTP